MRLLTAVVVSILVGGAACGGAAGDGPGPRAPAGATAGGRVVVVSIDGMMPETYLDPDRLGLKVPTLRTLVARGAYARAVQSTFPTVTYPAHTTLVTGVWPRAHGITSNRPLDVLHKNQEGWRWYSEDIAVPTLWQAAEAQGRAAALVMWPVTVGAKATFVVPEYWRAGTPEDQKLLRAISTPGLLDRVARGYPDLWKELTPPDVRDAAQFAIVKHLVTEENPDLVLMHVWMTDDAQHDHGPRSTEARAAFEHVDRLLGELLAALERSPQWSRTTLVVVSDHGFAAVEQELRLNALFAERGLIQRDAEGKVVSARVATIGNGGTCTVHVLDPAARAEVEAALAAVEPGILRAFTAEELAAAGAGGDATFALAAAPGYVFGNSLTGPAIAPKPRTGNHGFPPTAPEMAASFLAIGPRVPRRDLGAIPMIDIAPTIAQWLGVKLPTAAGTPIRGL